MQIGAIDIGARMGLGVDDLRWMMPVRPGDVLHIGSYAKFSVFF
jgi:acyl dehydratase